MENLKAIAITHHQFEMEEVGHFHIEEAEQNQRLLAIKKEFGFDELMFVSTCNRVEFLVCSNQEFTPAFLNRFFSALYPSLSTDFILKAADKINVYEKISVVEHLFKVASSLDSLVVGEREIITQVRKSYDRCKAVGLTGDTLRLLTQKTIETAKKVFTQTAIAARPVSVVSLAYKRLKLLQLPQNTRFVIVGAGQTIRNMLRFLVKDGFNQFSYFNRTLENTKELNGIAKGNSYSLEQLKEHQAGFDVLISCTGAANSIITSEIYSNLLASETDKKTIVHIPSVNSGESTKDKYDEVDAIIDEIGTFQGKDPDTGVITIKRKGDGKLIKMADLVHDDPKDRDKIVEYLRNIKSVDDMDVIIALGMAKEGFDWAYCEHSLTVGYRGSLTEIIQIIGRSTRDSENKSHAQFTNLIAQPDAADDQVKVAVNNMLKAITCSLLMEQVLAPNFKFKTKLADDAEATPPGTMKIGGFKEPSTQRTKDIVESDLADLKAAILQDDKIIAASAGAVDPEVVNKVLIPKIIQVKYPDLSAEEVEEIRQHVVVDSAVSTAKIKEEGDKKFIRMADKFVNIDDLNIDLIDSINPFQSAFEILSKSVTTNVLKLIQESIESTRIKMDFDEVKILWPKVNAFVKEKGRQPAIDAADLMERRLAECIIWIKEQKRKKAQEART